MGAFGNWLGRATSMSYVEADIPSFVQADFNKPAAVGSCFHWGIFTYNLHATKQLLQQSHPQMDEGRILAILQLSGDQVTKLLQAREILMHTIGHICHKRRDILAALGLQSLSRPKVIHHILGCWSQSFG